MRIVVLSDSHNDYYALDRVVMARPDAGLFLHLGDGEQEFDDLMSVYPDKKMLFVRGNCDWNSEKKTEELLICADKRIFLTHGHMYGVKRGLDRLEQRARLLSADICCFGHTHTACSTYRDGLHLLNPGSIALPRDGSASYAVIDITDAGIAIHIVRANQ